jgi:hypothetical protein
MGIVRNFFMAGAEMVRWHLTAVQTDGPYRLTLHHGHGVIVEYFKTSDSALVRQHELERLLVTARGAVSSAGIR